MASAIDCRFFAPRALFTEYDHTIVLLLSTSCTDVLALSAVSAQ
jgi:hypothetical protein